MKKTFVTYQVVAAYAKAMQQIVEQNMTSEEARDVLETIEHLRDNLQGQPFPNAVFDAERDANEKTEHARLWLSKAAVYALDLRFHLKATEDEAFGDFSDYIEDEVNNLNYYLDQLANLVKYFA